LQFQESKINYENDEGLKPEGCTGKIEFKNVNFCYPSRKDVEIMKGLSEPLQLVFKRLNLVPIIKEAQF
jgi:hypothetical protein